MNKKEYDFLERKLDELVQNGIISNQQFADARTFYASKVKQGKSIGTIFAGIGVLLIALSIITLFAVNWDALSKGVKSIVSFVPIVITAIMMYLCIIRENKKLVFYTGIFAPVSILATNSLIGQVFHVQTEIYELIFTSLIMFMPIAFILRTYLTMLVYAVGTVFYAFCAINEMTEIPALFSIILVALPMLIYNVIHYIKDKEERQNKLLWVANAVLITLFLLYRELVTEESIFVYLYLIYVLSLILFKKETVLNRIISVIFGAFLLISCINEGLVSYAEEITFGWSTLIVTILAAVCVYASKIYKEPKEYIVMALIILIQYIRMPSEILFVLINILAIIWGILKIILGNKEGEVKSIKQGIAIILYLIFIRFMNADIGFMEKSVIFLISGIGFIVGAKVLEKKLGGKKDA